MLPQLRELVGNASSTEMLDEMFDVIADTGYTTSATPYKSDFVPGTMQKVDEPIQIEGVGGDIKVEEVGMLKWELISTSGQVVKL